MDEHAALVRHIFHRYLALGNVRELMDELAAQRVIMPVRTSASGRSTGGGAFARGHLYFILRNPVYAGLIRHKEVDYPGQHLPIISSELWQQVQVKLADNTKGTRDGTRATHASPLAGLVIDEGGQALIATHATKANGSAKVRYRYYVAPARRDRGEAATALRIPARELESAVTAMLLRALSDPLELAACASLTLDAKRISDLIGTAEELAFRIKRHERALVRELVLSVQLTAAQLRVTVGIQALARLLQLPCPVDPASVILTEPMRLTRTGHAMRLIQADGRRATPEANASMVKLIARARIWWARLRTGELRVSDLAAEEGCTKSYVTRVVRLAFLSPALVEQIVAGTQPAALSSALLKQPDQPAISWVQQRRELGGSAAD